VVRQANHNKGKIMAANLTIKRTVLPPETVKQLKNLETEIKQSLHEFDVLEQMGMDVSKLREELKIAETRRELLLKHFS